MSSEVDLPLPVFVSLGITRTGVLLKPFVCQLSPRCIGRSLVNSANLPSQTGGSTQRCMSVDVFFIVHPAPAMQASFAQEGSIWEQVATVTSRRVTHSIGQKRTLTGEARSMSKERYMSTGNTFFCGRAFGFPAVSS